MLHLFVCSVGFPIYSQVEVLHVLIRDTFTNYLKWLFLKDKSTNFGERLFPVRNDGYLYIFHDREGVTYMGFKISGPNFNPDVYGFFRNGDFNDPLTKYWLILKWGSQ